MAFIEMIYKFDDVVMVDFVEDLNLIFESIDQKGRHSLKTHLFDGIRRRMINLAKTTDSKDFLESILFIVFFADHFHQYYLSISHKLANLMLTSLAKC